MNNETVAGDTPATPELDKQRRAREQGHSEEIGAFLEWLGEQDLCITEWREGIGGGRFYEIDGGINALLARYFDIDLDKIEQERLAILKYLRGKS